jgi:hypothetical protein
VGLKHTPELHFRRNTLTLERRRMEEAWLVRVCHALGASEHSG